MSERILFYSRKPEFGWLSNFERCSQMVGNIVYATNEHYYQSQKAKDVMIQKWIADAPNPFAAMKAGRNLRAKEMIDNWDKTKIAIMFEGLVAKFQDPILRQKLLDTGEAELHEDSPTDMFWGIKGEDMLGKLLMKVRDQIVV